MRKTITFGLIAVAAFGVIGSVAVFKNKNLVSGSSFEQEQTITFNSTTNLFAASGTNQNCYTSTGGSIYCALQGLNGTQFTTGGDANLTLSGLASNKSFAYSLGATYITKIQWTFNMETEAVVEYFNKSTKEYGYEKIAGSSFTWTPDADNKVNSKNYVLHITAPKDVEFKVIEIIVTYDYLACTANSWDY